MGKRRNKQGIEIVPYHDNMLIPEAMDAPMPDGMRPSIEQTRVGMLIERLHDGRASRMMKERAVEFVHREAQPLIEVMPDRSNQRWCSYCHDWHDLGKFDLVAGRAGGARGYCRTGYNSYMREYMREYQRELRGSKKRYGVYRSSLSQVSAATSANV